MTQIPGLFPGITSGFGPDMTTTFPSGSAPVTWLNNVPGSRAEAEKNIITSEGGGGRSQEPVNVNLMMQRWGGYDYHKEIFKGQPIFVIREGSGLESGDPPSFNLRQLNTLLAKGYQAGLAVWGDRAGIVDAGVVTDDQYELLMTTPTAVWSSFDFLTNILLNKQRSEYHSIRFLYEEGIRDRFAFFGYHNNSPDDLAYKQVAVTVGGTVEMVENCWSPTLDCGHKIGFVLKRFFDKTKGRNGEYTHFVMDPAPWSNGTVPSILGASYIDITGAWAEGKKEMIGSVDERVKFEEYDQAIVDEMVGKSPLVRQHLLIGPGERTHRISLHGRTEYTCLRWYGC